MSAPGWVLLLLVVLGPVWVAGGSWLALRRWHHAHVWEPVSAQPRRRLGVAAAFEASSPATLVLWHCARCPETTSTFLDGTWTLPEVRGVAPEPLPGRLELAVLDGGDDAEQHDAAGDLSP